MKILEDIDELLTYLEDTAHGEEGKRITEMRNRIHTELSNSHKPVLAVSGLTFDTIIETLTEALREINQYEYGQGERYENETYIKVHNVREALKAACANGAWDKTVRDGLWCECGIPNRNTTSSQCGTCFKPIG
jgi:hypothetical protein